MSSALSHEPRSANSEDRTALQDWIILLAIAMMVASDYKFRRRGLADSLGGTIDMAILFELAIYGIAGVVLVASHIKYGQRTRASGLMAALWVYGTILAISAVYAPFPSLAMVRGGQLILIIALTQVLADRAEPGQFRILCRVYVGLMIASIAIGIAYVAPTSSYQAGRFTWLHTHTVTAASMLAIGLIISVGLLTDRPPQRRSPVQSMALVASILAIGVALLMTQTRGSVGGAVVGLAVFTTLRVSKERRKGVVSLMVPLLAMAVFFSLQTVETYVARGESEEGLTTLSNRTVLWQVAYERFLEKPIFGWGLTASRGLFFDAVQLGGAHNAFVNAAVDGGLIGFTAWLISIGVLIYSIRRVWVEKPENHPQLALICGILATLLVNGITMEGIGSGSGASFIWLCLLIGWVQVLRRSPSVILPRSFGQESR